MRGFVITLFVALAVSCTAAAQAINTPSLSIKVSGINVLYGHHVTLSGRLSSGVGGRPVSVYARRFGQASPSKIATVATGFNGGWALRVEPQEDTSYQARAAAIVTPTLLVSVKPLIVTRVLSDGAIWAHVAAGRAFAGRLLELQHPTATGWVTVERSLLDKRSVALFPPPARGTARVRVAMSVNAAGAGLLGAASDPFVYHPHASAFVSAAASTSNVTFGHRLELLGRIPNGRAGQTVWILARKYGSPAPVRVAHVVTRGDGRWMAFVAPAIQTSYQARWGSLTSRLLVIGVRPAIAVRHLKGARIEATVAPSSVFLGRNVELQQRTAAGRWRTIAQIALARPAGRAVFPALTSTHLDLRVAMSVNEAGAGYLEASSATFAVNTRSVSLRLSASKVLYGHQLTLSGRISAGRAGESVTIFARPYGEPTPTEGIAVLTGPGGRWSFHAAPLIQTSYVAHWGTSQSRPVVAGVEPRMTVAVLSNGSVATRVIANRLLRGRLVQLQELTSAHRWSTIMRMPLDRRSSAIFAPVSTATVAPTLRVALSVNQAGVGLLGATSHAFVYRNPENV